MSRKCEVCGKGQVSGNAVSHSNRHTRRKWNANIQTVRIAEVNGGLDNMINWDGKDKDLLALIKYIADEDKLDKVLENPQVIKTPVVRNGRQSTIGYRPDVWKTWK